MSSEAQIKKRRDNKKKIKDDAVIEEKEYVPQDQPQLHTVPKTTTNGDLNIHVHKEPSTGGGLCAKLIFFVLLTVLTALIALLVNQHQANMELEVPGSSRYSKLVKRPVDELAVSAEESEENAYEENDTGEQQSAENNSEEEDNEEATELSQENQEDEEDENVTPDETGEVSEEVPEEPEDEDEENTDEDDDETDLPDDSRGQDNSDNEEDDQKDEESEETGTVLPNRQLKSEDDGNTEELPAQENYHSVKMNQDESYSENDEESDGAQAIYRFSDVTNTDDWTIKEKLDQANHTLQNE